MVWTEERWFSGGKEGTATKDHILHRWNAVGRHAPSLLVMGNVVTVAAEEEGEGGGGGGKDSSSSLLGRSSPQRSAYYYYSIQLWHFGRLQPIIRIQQRGYVRDQLVGPFP
jgi:hypothetical protein